eukprot:EG_transcript_19648
MKCITHVIFDMDGLLLNTEELYTRSTDELLRPFGTTMPMSLKVKMMGRKPEEAARLLIAELGVDLTPDEYLRRAAAIRDAMWPTADWMPGASELLDHLCRHNVPTALATASFADVLARKTERHRDRFARFRAVVSGDHPRVMRGKPAPDCYLLAAELLGADPSHCLVLEDAPNGVVAAKAAGMATVWVPHAFMLEEGIPLLDQPAVRELGADCTLASLADFRPEEWGLPAFSA